LKNGRSSFALPSSTVTVTICCRFRVQRWRVL
jgi:hypothetical protein